MHGFRGNWTAPIGSLITIRQIGFWAKLAHDDTPRLSKLILPVLESLQNTPIKGKRQLFNFEWLDTLHKSLSSLGLDHFSHNPTVISPKAVVTCANRAITRSSIQSWESDINTNEQCTNYRMFKKSWGMCTYLVKLPHKLRISMAKFRTRCHNLPICKNRFLSNKEPIQPTTAAKCPLCKASDSADEFHFIFKCTVFNEKRKNLIPPRFSGNPNAVSFYELFDSEQKVHCIMCEMTS